MVFYDESPAFRLAPEAALQGREAGGVVRQPDAAAQRLGVGSAVLDQAISIVEAPVGKGRVVLFGNEVALARAAARDVQAAVQRHLTTGPRWAARRRARTTEAAQGR